MAEFCKDCFISCLYPSQDEIDHIVMSEEVDLCEGCGKILPFVDYIDMEVGVRELSTYDDPESFQVIEVKVTYEF